MRTYFITSRNIFTASVMVVPKKPDNTYGSRPVFNSMQSGFRYSWKSHLKYHISLDFYLIPKSF